MSEWLDDDGPLEGWGTGTGTEVRLRLVLLPLLAGLDKLSQDTCGGVAGDSRLLCEDDGVWV